MGRIVVSENVTLDGVVQDLAGAEGFGRGGWGPLRCVALDQCGALGARDGPARTGRVARDTEAPAVRLRGGFRTGPSWWFRSSSRPCGRRACHPRLLALLPVPLGFFLHPLQPCVVVGELVEVGGGSCAPCSSSTFIPIRNWSTSKGALAQSIPISSPARRASSPVNSCRGSDMRLLRLLASEPLGSPASRSARCLIPSSILRSMTSEPGSIGIIPILSFSWGSRKRLRPRSAVQLFQHERPDPVPVRGLGRQPLAGADPRAARGRRCAC
jgi:hypothetical protein